MFYFNFSSGFFTHRFFFVFFYGHLFFKRFIFHRFLCFLFSHRFQVDTLPVKLFLFLFDIAERSVLFFSFLFFSIQFFLTTALKLFRGSFFTGSLKIMRQCYNKKNWRSLSTFVGFSFILSILFILLETNQDVSSFFRCYLFVLFIILEKIVKARQSNILTKSKRSLCKR